MKTSIFKLISGAFFAGILFSSCLGDSDNVIEKTEDFVYITSIGGTKVGAISYYPWTYITTGAIQGSTLLTNQFYIMGYRINTKNLGGNGNYYIAEDIGQLPKQVEQTKGLATAPPAIDNEFYPTTFVVVTYYPANTLYGDRWVFGAQASLKEEGKDFPIMNFYYDPANQREDTNNDGVTEEIGKNKMIIDVRFVAESFSEGQKTSRTFYSAGDLSGIRSYFQSQSGKLDYDGEKYIYIPIKFRYRKATKDSNNQDTTVEVFDGNWNTDSTGKYVMYFTAETGS
jgi:hypothetical protein